MKTITYNGEAFQYDEKAPKSISVVRGLAEVGENPAGYFAAIDKILAGTPDYAEKLGDDFEALNELIGLITEAVGAKN